jgi:hypothetical protein
MIRAREYWMRRPLGMLNVISSNELELPRNYNWEAFYVNDYCEGLMVRLKYHNIHTYHSRLIPEGVEAFQIFLAMRNTADVTGGKSIAV